MKEREFEASGDMADEAEYTDYLIIEGDICPVDGFPGEVIKDLPEVIDEDWLYEAYRDEGFELGKRRRDQ